MLGSLWNMSSGRLFEADWLTMAVNPRSTLRISKSKYMEGISWRRR